MGHPSKGAEELQRLLAEFARDVESLDVGAAAAELSHEAKEPRTVAPALPPLPAGGVSAFEAFTGAGAAGRTTTVAFSQLLFAVPRAESLQCRGERVAARAALEAFPHVLEGLALLWNETACLAYLQRLVVDTRGGRGGFPPEAMSELLFLCELLSLRR